MNWKIPWSLLLTLISFAGFASVQSEFTDPYLVIDTPTAEDLGFDVAVLQDAYVSLTMPELKGDNLESGVTVIGDLQYNSAGKDSNRRRTFGMLVIVATVPVPSIPCYQLRYVALL